MTIGRQAVGFWPHVRCTYARVELWAFDNARNQQPGKKTKAYSCTHFLRNWAAMTKAGAAKHRHCLISFGHFLWASISFFFFPTLPPSETFIYRLSYGLWVIWKVLCFEKTRHCWNNIDWRLCGGESCVSSRSVFFACALWPSRSDFKTPLKTTWLLWMIMFLVTSIST